MLAVKLKPALLPRGRWNSILAPGDVIAALIERRQAIEPFEFMSLLNCQTDEDASRSFLSTKYRRGEWSKGSIHAVRLRGDDEDDERGLVPRPVAQATIAKRPWRLSVPDRSR